MKRTLDYLIVWVMLFLGGAMLWAFILYLTDKSKLGAW